ncbi:fimbria/pilus outer membrane usher protein [Ramlibacter monticola]|uniref:Fimbrial biogenesis outer membrane usher protein n=1 Tax=Ramlibacter monticola TaxID=1926872 RepID=A0A937CSV8_9BURK|nr:fimbrial biogenesis outer membrane usher protein [Ramlibacter monticola]
MHAATPECEAGVERASRVELLLVQPIVNGEEREVARVRFLAPGGPLYLAQPDLARWGIATEKMTLQDFAGGRWLCVEGLGLRYELDPGQLTLVLDFPPDLHGGSRASVVTEDQLPMTYGRGGFLNYDLRYDRTAGLSSLGANWEFGAFGRPGLFTSSYFSGNRDRGTIRLDTAFRRDDPERITSFVLGDTITRPGNYGAAVRMAGVQYQRNFATAPLLVTYPTGDVSGTATVPSTVDVYIGNAKAYSTQVRPGPFSVSNLPVPVGAGNVQVVVRDLFGKESTVVVPYVRYDEMLKKGLHDFSYEAGVLRRDYAVESNSYGDWAAVATHRYGVTDWLTLEGHAEGMADRGNLGGVVQVTMPVLGLVGVGGAASSGLGHGRLGKAFFQRNERNWSIGAAVEQRSPDYVDIAFEPGQVRTLGVRQFSASARVGARNWVNALWLRTTDTSGEFNTATLGWTLTLSRSATLTANVSRFWGTQPASTVFSLTLALPLGERDFATATVERRSDFAKTDVLLDVSRNLLETDSFGYRILAGQQSGARRAELGAFLQTGAGQFGLEVADAFGTRSTRAYVRGGVAAAGGETRLSRYLDQSFAIVKVADFPDVRVYGNGQPLGKTDAGGIAVIPRLSGFLPSTIAFEAEDIPLEGSFGDNAKRLKIANRMGVLVDMGVARRLSATLTLTDPDGKPVPAGASVRIGEASEEFPVARQGRVYVSGLERGKSNALRVQIGERECRATVDLPSGFASGSTLGNFTCR